MRCTTPPTAAGALPTGRYLFFYDLQVDPGAPATLWLAGSDSRAGVPRLFRSTDAGQTWTRLSGAGGGITEVLAAPTTPTTIWVVTGPRRDGGATWEWVRRGLELAPVLGLAADTLNPERVYAGTGTRSVLVWEE